MRPAAANVVPVAMLLGLFIKAEEQSYETTLCVSILTDTIMSNVVIKNVEGKQPQGWVSEHACLSKGDKYLRGKWYGKKALFM